jgi:peptide/nickel transport system permease protein
MVRFLIRRLLFAILVLFVISFAVFILFYVVKSESPIARAASFAPKGANERTLQQIVIRLHFNQPWYQQYGHFLSRLLFHGDFGTDFVTQAPVKEELLSRLPVTASLALGSAVIWLALGIPFGILAATKPRSIRDRAATVFALLFYSIPTFVLGLLLLLIFYFYFRTKLHINIYQYGSYTPITQDPFEWFKALYLPWFSIALTLAASYSRVTRGSMLDVLGEDYIRTARAKGLSERKVVYKHGLRSALTPIVTIFGVDFGVLLGGAIITEQIFALPGVGAFSLRAVIAGDLPVVSATVLLAAAFVVLANLIVDITYAFLDPRVRLS